MPSRGSYRAWRRWSARSCTSKNGRQLFSRDVCRNHGNFVPPRPVAVCSIDSHLHGDVCVSLRKESIGHPGGKSCCALEQSLRALHCPLAGFNARRSFVFFFLFFFSFFFGHRLLTGLSLMSLLSFWHTDRNQLQHSQHRRNSFCVIPLKRFESATQLVAERFDEHKTKQHRTSDRSARKNCHHPAFRSLRV